MNKYRLLKINSVLWIALVILLPITSMPLVARIVGSDAVAAPSGIFLLGMVIFWLIPFILAGGDFSGISEPLLIFFVVAVGSTALSYFRDIPIWKENNLILSQLEALITLAVGMCFYLVAKTWLSNVNSIKTTLKIINWSGGIILLWSIIQAISWFAWNHYPVWMRSFHELYSIGPLFRQRVVGFTMEPSWLAHQLNLIYIPYWLAATVCLFSVHKTRFWKISFENLLLGGSLVVLGLTFSRIGLLGILLMIAYLVFRSNIWLGKKVKGLLGEGKRTIMFRSPIRLLISSVPIMMILAYFFAIVAVGYLLSILDPRMANLFKFELNQPNPILYYAKQLTVAARLVYWQAGWNVFTNYPWFGVGFGNAGFLLPEKLSVEAMGLTEVRQLLYRTPLLLNIKSIWIRLLAESGIVGFSLFICWLFSIWKSAQVLMKFDQALLRTIGWMGILAILGLVFEGFSLDSFALPYFWLTFGILTAANNEKIVSELKVNI